MLKKVETQPSGYSRLSTMGLRSMYGMDRFEMQEDDSKTPSLTAMETAHSTSN